MDNLRKVLVLKQVSTVSNFSFGGPSPSCFYGDVIALLGMFHNMTNRFTSHLFNYRWFYCSNSDCEWGCLSIDLTCNLVWFGVHAEKQVLPPSTRKVTQYTDGGTYGNFWIKVNTLNNNIKTFNQSVKLITP
ncbi:hypothetical protein NL108_004640 [Boleophthalmus pectinirostris]|nr:hypothetical protein NL108_004640 [Boleophthalmus pectinirostris]